MGSLCLDGRCKCTLTADPTFQFYADPDPEHCFHQFVEDTEQHKGLFSVTQCCDPEWFFPDPTFSFDFGSISVSLFYSYPVQNSTWIFANILNINSTFVVVFPSCKCVRLHIETK
jgi:hypothetical protein